MDSDPRPRADWLERLKRTLLGKRRVLSEEELHELIEESELGGLIGEEEGEMLHSIFEFGDILVREIMVPRTDMVCSNVTAPVEEIVATIIKSGHSRVPVYEDSVDNIVGILYAKDLLKYWGRQEQLKVDRLLRKAYFVPETKLVEDLLKEFKTKRVHMAIAVDEYGGTSGLITIEDVLEEIVGDIQDEYDSEEEWIIPQDDGSALVDARLNIEELEEHFEVELPRAKFDTIGGLIVDILGHIPSPGERVRTGVLDIEILESDTRRIQRVLVANRPEPVPTES